jgi:hypothetical protein
MAAHGWHSSAATRAEAAKVMVERSECDGRWCGEGGGTTAYPSGGDEGNDDVRTEDER